MIGMVAQGKAAMVLYEMHKGAQRFAQFSHACGWVSPWLPVKHNTRMISCAKCDPAHEKTITEAEAALLRFYNVS